MYSQVFELAQMAGRNGVVAVGNGQKQHASLCDPRSGVLLCVIHQDTPSQKKNIRNQFLEAGTRRYPTVRE